MLCLQIGLFKLMRLRDKAIDALDISRIWLLKKLLMYVFTTYVSRLLDEKLLENDLGGGLAADRQDCVDGVLDLLAEGATIVNHVQFVVANVAFAKSCVALIRFCSRLKSCLIVVIVEVLCTIGRRHHMDNGFIPVVAQLDFSPAHLLQNLIEQHWASVAKCVHQASIAHNDRREICVPCNIGKSILEGHLGFH